MQTQMMDHVWSIIFGCTGPRQHLTLILYANTRQWVIVLKQLIGCTDPLALNYNELANVEDGSCIDAIYGCTGPNII
jgi:hypothetical protein